MLGLLRFPILSGFLLSAGLLLSSPGAHAQTAIPTGTPAARGYDFLTVTTAEGTKAFSFILFSSPFQGKTEIPLEGINTLGGDKYKERINQNAQLINEQLSALTGAGWELVQVYSSTTLTNGRSYLFRKAKS